MVKAERNNEYVATGWHVVEALADHSPQKIQHIYLKAERQDARAQRLMALVRARAIPLTLLTAESFKSAAERYAVPSNHQGIFALLKLAISPTTDSTLEEILAAASTSPLLLVLDGVQDPHNLGACLRSANAAGAQAVIIPKDRAAAVTPVVRKAASGATEQTPVITVTNLARALRELKEQGVWIYGLTGHASKLWYAADFRVPTALVLGAEGEGLRALTEKCCDELLRIPMMGIVNSLNVSVAAGICLFEVVRQRA